jgi:hypothetical protein
VQPNRVAIAASAAARQTGAESSARLNSARQRAMINGSRPSTSRATLVVGETTFGMATAAAVDVTAAADAAQAWRARARN